VLLRKRVSRHIEQCDVCGERKRRELSPAMLLGALPVFMLPPGLREQVLRLVSDPRPQAARYREHVAHQAEPFGRSGFPVSVAPLTRLRPRGRTIAFATVAALLLILVGGVAAAAMLRHGGGTANAAAHGTATLGASPTASASSSPTGPGKSPDVKHKKAAASASPSAVPSSTNPAAAPKPTATSKPTPTKSPTKSPTPSPSPPPSPGTLSESPATIRIPELDDSATFTLTANGGPVSFAITGPTGLTISPASGDLTAGETVTVTVTAVGNGPPAFINDLTLDPGGLTVQVDYPPKG
jgi:hypothetical protein